MIYFDNAATSFPKPPDVLRAVVACLQTYAVNPGRGGHRLSARAGEAVFETRESLSSLFGGAPERTVFTKNCTESINCVLQGVLNPGDHVIVSSLEHNAVLRPLEHLRQTGGVQYDVAFVTPNDTEKTLAAVRSLLRPETRLLFFTHVSNVFGTLLPLKALGAFAHEHGLLFAVDAAQSAGTESIDLTRDNIDYLCLPGHKGLFAPSGTGALLLGARDLPRPLLFGGTGSASLSPVQPAAPPERFESGTLNLPGIVGLGAGLRFLRRYGGPEAVKETETRLVRVLREDLSVIPNVRVFDEMLTDGEGTLLSFCVSGVHSEETAAALSDCGFAVRAGYHCAMLAHTCYGTEKTGAVRVSPGVFNQFAQIKKFTFCLNQIAMRKKIC